MVANSASTLISEEPNTIPANHNHLRLVLPPPPSRGVTSAQLPTSGSGGMPILGYLRYRWLMLLTLGFVLSVIFAGLAFKLIPSKFTTYGMIRVSMETPAIYGQENPLGRNDFSTYLRTQPDLIRSWQVLNAAIREPGISRLKILQEQIDPIKFLEEDLKIETKEGSEIIKLSLSGADPESITLIVNQIMEAYNREIVQEDRLRKKKRLQSLEEEIVSNQKIVGQMYKDRNLTQVEQPSPLDEVKDGGIQEPLEKPIENALTAKENGNQALGAKNIQEINRANNLDANDPENGKKKKKKLLPEQITPQLAAAEFVRLQQALNDTESQINNAKMKITNYEDRLKNLDREVKIDPRFLTEMEKDPEVQKMKKKLAGIDKFIDYDIKKLGAPENDPHVLAKRKEKKDLEKELEKWRNELSKEIGKTIGESIQAKFKQEGEELQLSLQMLESRKTQQQSLIAKYKAVLDAPQGGSETPPDFWYVGLKQRETIIKGMIDKANTLRVEINAPPRIQLYKAAVPVKKDLKKVIMGSIAAGFLGFALIGLLVVGLELKAERTLSLLHLQNRIIAPIIGIIPARNLLQIPGGKNSNRAPATDWSMVSHALDARSESYDKTRTQLLQQFNNPQKKIVLITSAEGEKESARFVTEIAERFALTSARVLMVDFDLRTPSLHRLKQLDNNTGVCEILKHHVHWSQAVHAFQDHFHFLPAGKWDDSIRSLLLPHHLRALLDQWQQNYDWIIMHTHPILRVSETYILAQFSDAVILSVEKYSSRISMVQRTQEKIVACNPECFGLVLLNASEHESLT